MGLHFLKDPNYRLVCVRLCGQGVIKHHNSVSLSGLKEKTEKKRRGEMKVSPTSMRGIEEGGGDGRRKDQQSFIKTFSLCLSSLLHVLCFWLQVCWLFCLFNLGCVSLRVYMLQLKIKMDILTEQCRSQHEVPLCASLQPLDFKAHWCMLVVKWPEYTLEKAVLPKSPLCQGSLFKYIIVDTPAESSLFWYWTIFIQIYIWLKSCFCLTIFFCFILGK